MRYQAFLLDAFHAAYFSGNGIGITRYHQEDCRLLVDRWSPLDPKLPACGCGVLLLLVSRLQLSAFRASCLSRVLSIHEYEGDIDTQEDAKNNEFVISVDVVSANDCITCEEGAACFGTAFGKYTQPRCTLLLDSCLYLHLYGKG